MMENGMRKHFQRGIHILYGLGKGTKYSESGERFREIREIKAVPSLIAHNFRNLD